MSPSSRTVPYLLLLFHSLHVEAEMFLTGSRPEHKGFVTIVGENKSCNTAVDAVLRREMTSDCLGMWFYKNGTELNCQTTICPPSPGAMNHVPGQSGLRAPSKKVTQRWQKHAFFHANVNTFSGLVPNRRWAIILTNESMFYWRIYASLGLNELTRSDDICKICTWSNDSVWNILKK